MFEMNRADILEQDRDDLIEVLRIRFGDVPRKVVEAIEQIDQLDTLQRLILIGANASNWDVFVEELQGGDGAFRLVGERFNPLSQYADKGANAYGKKEG